MDNVESESSGANFPKGDTSMWARQIITLSVLAVAVLAFVFSASNIVENLDAGQVMVVQSPISGTLTWHIAPGMKWQGFGKVTKYNKRSQFWFSDEKGQGDDEDDAIKVRFNDGGHAEISGGISWEIPTESELLTKLHTKFGSQEAVERQLIKTLVSKAIYMTGPLMSSTESYASRRNELLHLIEDQIEHGIYLTKTVSQKQKDPITGEDKWVSIVELVKDEAGHVERAEDPPLTEFGIKTFNLAINNIPYEQRVEDQIRQQQEATMRVQIAMAEAKRAEQQVLTTRKEGEASAAKAEWEQKAIAAKETQKALMEKVVAETGAEKQLAVAKLDKEAAEQFKLAEIARGEGESGRRKLVMAADGALEKKLDAWLKAQQAYATAIGQYRGAWVPSVVFGGANGNGAGTENGAQQLISLLTAKTAIDLGLDMSMNRTPPTGAAASTK